MDFVKMWYEDKMSMIDTMTRNMLSDIENGYSPIGNCIRKQMQDITDYRNDFESKWMELAEKEEKTAQRWCKHDLVRRGVIEL